MGISFLETKRGWGLAVLFAFMASPAAALAQTEVGAGLTRLPNGHYQLRAEGANWAVDFPARAFEIISSKERGNGRSRYVHMANEAGVNISFYFEPTSRCQTAISCRQDMVDQPSPSMRASEDVRFYETNGFYVVHYFMKTADDAMARELPQLAGVELNQKNINAIYVRDGYWVDMHMSRVRASAVDEKRFREFVSSISIIED